MAEQIMDSSSYLDLEQIKTIEYDILCQFDAFCRKYRLRYWIYYGTLLGAVRHKDFIPWDDDVDVAMPVQDYRRMQALLKAGAQVGPHLKFVSPSFTEYVTVPWGKVVDTRTRAYQDIVKDDSDVDEKGLWIDIFPLYTVKKAVKLHMLYRRLGFIGYALFRHLFWKEQQPKTYWGRLLKKPALTLAKIIGKQRTACLIEKMYLGKGFVFNQGEIVFEAWCGWVLNSKNLFSNTVLLPFREKYFPAPGGYHDILSCSYGDYMKIPPIEEREVHPMKVLIKEH